MEPKLLIAHVGCGNEILTADVLQLGSELWLVPQWLVSLDGQRQIPARAIRVDGLPHQRSGAFGADLTLNDPIPTDVLHGDAVSGEGRQYEVLVGPSDHFPEVAVRRGQ